MQSTFHTGDRSYRSRIYSSTGAAMVETAIAIALLAAITLVAVRDVGDQTSKTFQIAGGGSSTTSCPDDGWGDNCGGNVEGD